MVGIRNIDRKKILEDEIIINMSFKNCNDIIILLGETKEGLGGSEFARQLGLNHLALPAVDLKEEKSIDDFCRKLVLDELISAAHDISCGGLACALAESATEAFGIEVSIKELVQNNLSVESILFGESQARIIISIEPAKLNIFTELAKNNGIYYHILGEVKGNRFKIDNYIDLPISHIQEAYFNSIEESVSKSI
jgi:phosphoribosylformylglycinamidine synthase